MDPIQTMIDSVETSVTGLRLFKTLEEASYYHIFKSRFVMLPSSIWPTLENVDPIRLTQDPYPEGRRPRGDRDLASVKYHRRMIRKHGHTSPVWVAKKGDRYIKLDGVHRLVASNLEHKRSIPCYIVDV
jgi:hypothetical protein